MGDRVWHLLYQQHNRRRRVVIERDANGSVQSTNDRCEGRWGQVFSDNTKLKQKILALKSATAKADRWFANHIIEQTVGALHLTNNPGPRHRHVHQFNIFLLFVSPTTCTVLEMSARHSLSLDTRDPSTYKFRL